jgi:hypothetical protein
MHSCFKNAELETVKFLSLKTEPKVTITGEEIKYKARDKLARTYQVLSLLDFLCVQMIYNTVFVKCF